ncbi:transcriptional regulator [Parafrankia colletiae]|uniref:Transcriptional regulator n=2 Tax=Parafrankia colletiae TaxID=573497 RepID=A0A1S1R9V6_9ACTN|nr:transcriptional regulator [Parafrankia colletiae]
MGMVRTALTPAERARGCRLGALLREARGARAVAEIALAAGLSVETLRKIESGRIPTPTFFTVAALARALDLSLDTLAHTCDAPSYDTSTARPAAAAGLPTVTAGAGAGG